MSAPTTNSCATLQSSLGWCEGTPELPGLRKRLYYIAKSLIATWPTLSRTTGGQLNSASYTGNFTLLADATFKYIDILCDKSQLTSDPQGEYPSQTQLNKLVAVHPGVGAAASAAAAYLNNSDNVFIVQDMSGRWRVIGSERWMTKTTVAQDIGQGATGTAATTITVEATDECPAPFFTGTIEVEAGTLSCSTGAITPEEDDDD